MNANPPETSRRRWILVTIALSAIAVFALAALLINILERKQEARNPFYRVVDLNDTVSDPAVWGKNFPMQFELFLRTVDMERTKYGGSEAEPRSPTQADPRSVVARSKLEKDPGSKRCGPATPFRKITGATWPRLHARRSDLHRRPAV